MDSAKWKAVKNAYTSVVELARDERPSFLFGLSDDIRIEVEKLMEADPDAAGFISKPFLVELGVVARDNGIDLSGNQIDDYVLLKTIGSGGMGTVYLAERKGEGFSQKVAVKLIKRGMDTNAVLKRFLMERQILANLEHPFIARMLDGGSTPDGLPYFVMEHVNGEPIRSYCDTHGLETTSRLKLFSKVCTAIIYAHQNLVVHRDLKPSNILINEEGDPKLLDFGIAKLLSSDWNTTTEAATATQFRILTPEYASPEQLRGKPTTTATDVYSLGVVLYELLTGQRPFRFAGKNASEVADAILTQEPPRPSTVVVSVNGAIDVESKETANENDRRTGEENPHAVTRRIISNPKTLRGDLDNIVLKAIRRDPERRYQSVQEFNEDIDRYLRGLPVKATADSKVYRFGKFVKRHRAGVFASAFTGLVLLFATGVTGWQYVEAGREKAKAEMRFNEVRKLANSILFDHYEKIKDLPGSTEAKAKLVADAVNYLDSVSRESIDDPELQRELVQAYQKLAEIKGSTKGIGDLGDTTGAFDYYQKALAIQESLTAADPSNVQDQRRLALLLSDASYVAMGSLPESDNYKDRSFRLFAMLRTLNPDREQAESDYARAVWDRAGRVRRNGDNSAAITFFSEAASIYEALYNGGAGNKKYRRSAALTYKNLGTVYNVTDDFVSGLACYEKALAYDKQIVKENPDGLEGRIGLSLSYRGVGESLNGQKEYAKAATSFSEAIKIQEQIMASDPKNAFVADNLLESYAGAGVSYREMSNFDSAESYFARVFEIEKNLKHARTDFLRRLIIAKAHLEYAEMLLKNRGSGNTAAAKKELQTALDVFEDVKSARPIDPAMVEPYERIKTLLASL